MSDAYNAARAAGQANCNNPRYYINTKRGLHRYVPPGDDSPFAVQIKGKWHSVYRIVTDSEFFAAHPDTPYRMTVRQLDPDDPWIFCVKVTTRDGESVLADNFDVAAALDHVGGGSRRERLKAAARRLLGDPNFSPLAA